MRNNKKSNYKNLNNRNPSSLQVFNRKRAYNKFNTICKLIFRNNIYRF